MYWPPLPPDMQPDEDQLHVLEDDGDLTRHENDDPETPPRPVE